MELIRSLDDFPTRLCDGAISIGNFDGVHRGHSRIIRQLTDRAKQIGGAAIVFTFDPHPVRVLRPDAVPPPLTWTRRKAELLGQLGVDAMFAYPTDTQVLSLSATEFFRQIILERLSAKAIVEGPNFFFGKDRTGDVNLLTQLCVEHQMNLDIVEPLQEGEGFVSSSRIRAAIQAGDVAAARAMLTEPYRIRGMVTHGVARGSKIGFPTANLDAIDTLVPGRGVYAGRASLDDTSYAAAINIGPNPTFGEDAHKVEIHLLDFSKSIYGEPLEVDFLARLRDIQPFENIEALQRQLRRDVTETNVSTLPRKNQNERSMAGVCTTS